MEDTKIISLFEARSEQAITALSTQYGSTCAKVAHNILGNPQDVEECLNDAYLAVWNTIPPQKPQRLLHYVCAIVRNLACKQYHAKTAQKRSTQYAVSLEELEGCLPSANSMERHWDSEAIAESLNTFLSGLDRNHRILFVRRYWQAESIEALAAHFGTSKHNISVRLSRLRKHLQRHLEQEGVFL